ncbi:MAG TPA: hypothetical protein VGW36_00255 [Pyrinomonadaceae bacterium]|nr:hypothetical protein [Pyrinomonadaceae bacterium]
MKRFVAFAIVLLCNSVAFGMQDAGWVKFNSALGNFSVLMPCTPKENKETKDSPLGPYTSYIFNCTSPEREIFLAGWVDYDPKFIFNPQKELEANRDNFVTGVKAVLGSSTNISYRGYQGMEFDCSTDQVTFKSRVFIVGKRPYMLVIAYLKGSERPQHVNRFFSSFDPGRTGT